MEYYYLETPPPARPVLILDILTSAPFGIPGVACSGCNNTWADFVPIPTVCPTEFRRWLAERRGAPLTVNESNDLLLDLSRLLAIPLNTIRPGNALLPMISTMPQSNRDFHWSFMPRSVLVSQQVKSAFEQHAIAGANFSVPILIELVPENEFFNKAREHAGSLCDQREFHKSSSWWHLTAPYIHNFPEIPSEYYGCKLCRRVNVEQLPQDLVSTLVQRFDIVRVTWHRFAISARVKKLIESCGFTNARCDRVFE